MKTNLLISVRPEYAIKILSREKTVELRRRFPELEGQDANALIYSSSPVSAIVGRARILEVTRLSVSQIWADHRDRACISRRAFYDYFAGLRFGFAIFLSDAAWLNRQLSAAHIEKRYGIVPPQSYRYLNGEYSHLLSDGRVQVPSRHKRGHRVGRCSRC
jgi:predicted transcriptional regulator